MALNWSELGVFISVCGSVLVSLCFAIQKSHCKQINLCCGAIKCDRVVADDPPTDAENPTVPPQQPLP